MTDARQSRREALLSRLRDDHLKRHAGDRPVPITDGGRPIREVF